jgi:integrase
VVQIVRVSWQNSLSRNITDGFVNLLMILRCSLLRLNVTIPRHAGIDKCSFLARSIKPLRPLQGKSPYVFTTEQGTPVTTAWFLRMVQRTGRATKLSFPVHPHTLRHSTGYKLANDRHDTRSLAHYLGHRNLQSTARYTALSA